MCVCVCVCVCVEQARTVMGSRGEKGVAVRHGANLECTTLDEFQFLSAPRINNSVSQLRCMSAFEHKTIVCEQVQCVTKG
jgi:hypothetical protein